MTHAQQQLATSTYVHVYQFIIEYIFYVWQTVRYLKCGMLQERERCVTYRIKRNFGGKKFWRNCDFETLVEKTLANPRLACIFIILRAR